MMETQTVLLPPATIGVLGGGQLGAMLCEAGRRMGYRMVVLSEDATDPAGRWADEHLLGSTSDVAAVLKLASRAEVLTNEFEQVPPAVLQAVEKQGKCRVAPSSKVQATCRDRRLEKGLFAKYGFPHGPFAIVQKASEMAPAYEKLSAGGTRRVVAKLACGGYDGKGQVWMTSSAEAENAYTELMQDTTACADGAAALLLEQAVEFVAEASVIAARSPAGESASFPMFKNEHRHGILFQTVTPAGFSRETEAKARAYAEAIAEKLGVVGLLAVEMFVLANGDVWMNELAARPHNSGHVTLRATTRSQFEMHIAAICNLPLVSVEALRPGVMTNLLGDLWTNGEPQWGELFREPHGTLHLYGKTPRPGRKMGHMIHTAATAEEALAAANSVFRKLL